MRKITALLIAVTLVLAAAKADNRWKFYGAYHNALQNIPVGNVIYSLFDGSICSYAPGDTEVRTYDKTTGLSDVNIRFMAYCKEKNCFVLVYANSNIDLFFPDESGVINIPQYKNSALADKTVNDLYVDGTTAYLATNVGVAELNIARAEFKNTYQLGSAVTTCAYMDGSIYASTESGVLVGDADDNLLDISKWQPAVKKSFKILRPYGGTLYGAADGLYKLSADAGAAERVAAGNLAFLNAANDDMLICGNRDAVHMVAPDGKVTTVHQRNGFKYISLAGNTFWVSGGFDGLQPYKRAESGKFEAAGTSVTLNSPMRNYCAFMHTTPSNRVLVAGGTLNYNLLDYDGTLYYYENQRFFNFEDTISKITGLPYRNLTGIAEDPLNPKHHFASSGESGVYEFLDGKMVAHYDDHNSSLLSAVPTSSHSNMYVRAGALTFDGEGNLWMMNDEVDTVMHVRLKDGTWQPIYLAAVENYPTFDHMIVDNAGRAWFTHRRTTTRHNAGLGCLDYNGTIKNTADDKFMFRHTFVNQDGISYAPVGVSAIAVDRDGYIWVGTVDGPFLVTRPDNYMSTNFTFTQVKVPRNDGTNNADYLLSGVPVSAIAVDDANRKWIGTTGNGLYLISADNIETIRHFTVDNSPLVSNNILSLAVNNATGEVMIGTDEGLMGFMGGKTDSPGKVKDKDLKIYPNPVRPDYFGDVTIEGLPYGAEVKITTTGGQVVTSGKSISGEYKWDVRDAFGNDIGSGVYYVLVVTSDGKQGAGGKIVVVR